MTDPTHDNATADYAKLVKQLRNMDGFMWNPTAADAITALQTRVAELEAELASVKAHRQGFFDLKCRYYADLQAALSRVTEAKAEAAAMRKAAADYCWARYKGRDPLNLKYPAVFTSHEHQKIVETMDRAAAALAQSGGADPAQGDSK